MPRDTPPLSARPSAVAVHAILDAERKLAAGNPASRTAARKLSTLLIYGLLAGMGLSLSACNGSDGADVVAEPEPIRDLVAAFGEATVNRPTYLVDLGKSSARPHLISGWSLESRNLEDAAGRDVTWSIGDRALLEFFADEPRDLRVTADFGGLGAISGTHVDFEINGQPWQRIEVRKGIRTHELALPAGLLRAGINRLQIVHAENPGAPRNPRKDFRLVWDAIRFSGWQGVEKTAPVPRPERSMLFIPFGTRVDYHLDLPPASLLEAEMARIRGNVTGRLEVSWTPATGEATLASRDFTAAPGFRAELGEGPGRLSLFALADAAVEDRSEGILLRAPELSTLDPSALAAPLPPQQARVEGPAFEGRKPNILVYLIDTLRADHLGCYGYPLPTSPNLDALAAEGVLFENAQAQSPWTRASVASIFTGRLPQSHGANDQEDMLSEELPTLAEILSEAGYATAAISANVNASATYGFDQGFDYFKQLRHLRPDEPLARSTDVHDATVRWIDDIYLGGGEAGTEVGVVAGAGEQGSERPFFLWVHAIDPHAPYEAPEPFHSRFAEGVDGKIGKIGAIQGLVRSKDRIPEETVRDLTRLYDAEVASNDHAFGELRKALEERGLFRDTLVVVVSDHGEEFYEHGGWTHGKTLYTEMLDVPLIIKPPGAAIGRRTEILAQHIDLLPTLASAAGLEAPDSTEGRSLVPWLLPGSAPEPSVDETAVAYMRLRGRHGSSYLDTEWKLVQLFHEGELGFPELYDRQKDRPEAEDLAVASPDLALYLASRLADANRRSFAGAVEAGQVTEEDKELLEELRALGYIQ